VQRQSDGLKNRSLDFYVEQPKQSLAMKAFLFMSAFLGIAEISTHADAQNYPWCGYYKEDVNCGFTTYEQCMATVRGSGGYCARNTQFVPPPGPRPRYLAR
jgi:hypothetical protein